MNTPSYKPESSRAKVVFFLWRNLPRFVLLGLFILTVFMFLAIKEKSASIAADKESAIAQERPLVNTVTLTLEPTTLKDRINLPGDIQAWTRLNLLAEVGGNITEVLIIEGQHVKKGEVLAQIDPRDYEITLARAEAAHTLAQADYERDKKVYAKGVIPKAEIEAKQTRLKTAKADLDNAKLLLSRCTIKAPMAGVINRLDAKRGLLLSVGDPMIEILKIDKVKAVVGIPESDITAVRTLNQVELTIQALDEQIFIGEKHFLASSPDSAARLYRLELALDNSDGRMLPGMFIRADVVKQTLDNSVAIPFYSVISRNNEQYVFVEKDGVVEKRTVELGIMERWMVEVKSGLVAGERVVIEGHRDIENKQKVKVVKNIVEMGDYTL